MRYERQGWEKTNQQRGELIDKKIAGNLSDDEKQSLDGLQAYADYYLERTTPRPEKHIEALEKHVAALSLRKNT